MGARRRRRRRLAWTGRRGYFAWIWSQRKKFAMLTCDEQEVSAQLGCLSNLPDEGRRDNPGSSKGQKRNGGETTKPNIITPLKERSLPLPIAPSRAAAFVQSLLLFPSGIILQISFLFFIHPSPPYINYQHVASVLPPPPITGGRLAVWFYTAGHPGARWGGRSIWTRKRWHNIHHTDTLGF